MNDPILITGMERSGISLIGEAVRICGAWRGQPKEILDAVVKPFFRGIKADVSAQAPLPDIETCKKLAASIREKWNSRVKDIITEHGYDHGAWFYADPKSCLIWPVWNDAFPEARWVIVRRKDNDIIKSCLKTGYMSAYDDAAGWMRWIEDYKKRFEEMVKAGLNIWQIWPQRMLRGKLEEVKAMIQFLGLEWKAKEMEDFITPILWQEGIFETSE